MQDQVILMTESALPTNGLGNATQANVQSTHPASDYPLCMMWATYATLATKY